MPEPAEKQVQPEKKQPPPEYIKEVVDKTFGKRTESPQAYIIIVVSYADDLLTKLIKKNLVVPNNSDELFDDSQPLFNFGPKIEMAYRLGFISPELLWTLHKLRKLRDRCAHSQEKIAFSDGAIRDLISEIHSRFSKKHHKATTTEEKFYDITSSVLIILWKKFTETATVKSAASKEWLFS